MNFKAIVSINPALRTQALRQLVELNEQDMAEITKRMDAKFRANESRLFASEGSSGAGGTGDASKWAPLSPRYRKWKAKNFPGNKILELRGRLKRSLTQQGGEHVASYTVRPQAVVTMGTMDEVAAYHAPGDFHNPHLPVRDPLQHTDEQVGQYTEAANTYLVGWKLPRVLKVLQAWHRSTKPRASGA